MQGWSLLQKVTSNARQGANQKDVPALEQVSLAVQHFQLPEPTALLKQPQLTRFQFTNLQPLSYPGSDREK